MNQVSINLAESQNIGNDNTMLNLNQLPLILASNSPRRQALLKQIDLDFRVIPSNVHEDFNIPLKPKNFVEHYAFLKAEAVAQKHPDCIVFGMDTIVVLDNAIIGKPKDAIDSFNMLNKLSGRTHAVLTGISIHKNDQAISDTFSVTTKVTFNKLQPEQIRYYIEKYKPFDKAGSYGIQDWFAVCVKKINGCYYNVMGLPISAFYSHLTKFAAKVID